MHYVSWEKSGWVSTKTSSPENNHHKAQTTGETGSKENQAEVTAYSLQEKMSQPRPEHRKPSGFTRLLLEDVKSLIWDKKSFSLKRDAHHGSVKERERQGFIIQWECDGCNYQDEFSPEPFSV